jgi:hypothetical protein
MSLLGGVLGVGGSILGGLFNDDGGVDAANAINAGLNSRISNLFRESLERNRLGFFRAGQMLDQRTDQVLGDIDRARADLGGAVRQTRRDIYDNRTRTEASAQQGLIGSGLSNSSIGANMQRGIAADTSRQLGAANQALALGLSGLERQRAGVRSALLGDQANLNIQEQQSFANIANNYANALNQQGAVPGAPSSGGSQLGGLLGLALGGENTNLSGVFGDLAGIFS